MTETIGCDSTWHLAHSRPADLLDYFDPTRGFAGQINPLVSRFRDVQALCDGGESDAPLTHLRNALAFHLVKMSRWWGFDFCPRGLTDVRNPLFLSYVKAHAARVAEDESFFDLFTMQRHMHANDAGHILVLGRDGAVPALLYGLDGQRGFRFAFQTNGADIAWYRHSYSDFTSAWLAARTVGTPGAAACDTLPEHLAAEREHAWARTWHQRYFHRAGTRPVVQLYAEACAQRSVCQSSFGRTEFETIVNDLAFKIARTAFTRALTIADMIAEGGTGDMNLRVVDTIRQRARTFVATCVDPCRRPELDTLLDRTVAYRPRRCS
ncbi:hypothetical protein HLH34_10900 [Gluconacetobacter azotocaptans]|uniref:Uncharacterized protein n=1 Tax=Gluconacetobacter azotocaptans TaxID=142834 RepID=A0A7W4JTA0_9PROT|nr:hypothetical protein [Gluconacetobacter azotocaptans]MBB2190464.1 hypothetical protein [Gluconacetobacter azotocaptans]GBQ28825.1 hypothetical protein AA13594_1145 [Gluconacetobacter azotocaptans DSM 13594]